MFGLTHLLAPSVVRLLISSDSIFDATMEFLNWRIFGFFFAFINVMFRALYIGITRTKVLTMKKTNQVVMAKKYCTMVKHDILRILPNKEKSIFCQ